MEKRYGITAFLCSGKNNETNETVIMLCERGEVAQAVEELIERHGDRLLILKVVPRSAGSFDRRTE